MSKESVSAAPPASETRPGQGGSGSMPPPKARRPQENLDRIESLAREIYVSRGMKHGINPEQQALESLAAAEAFFAVADRRRAEAN